METIYNGSVNSISDNFINKLLNYYFNSGRIDNFYKEEREKVLDNI